MQALSEFGAEGRVGGRVGDAWQDALLQVRVQHALAVAAPVRPRPCQKSVNPRRVGLLRSQLLRQPLQRILRQCAVNEVSRSSKGLLLLLHAFPVLQGPGAFCNTVLIADFHPSRSLHFLHQSKRSRMLCKSCQGSVTTQENQLRTQQMKVMSMVDTTLHAPPGAAGLKLSLHTTVGIGVACIASLRVQSLMSCQSRAQWLALGTETTHAVHWLV